VLGVRVYDPELGRFLQPDPLVADPADPQAFNRYPYGRNNPLSWLDPSGLYPETGLYEEIGLYPEPGASLACGEYSCGGGGDVGGWDRELDPGITPGDPDYYGPLPGPPPIFLPYDPSGGSRIGAPASRGTSAPPAPNRPFTSRTRGRLARWRTGEGATLKGCECARCSSLVAATIDRHLVVLVGAVWILFLGLVIADYAITARVYRVLQTRFPEDWNRLGRPTVVLNNSIGNSIAVMG
jgi:hypothetical protein